MARQEADREDLLAEATALVRRAELRIAGEPSLIVAGVRDNGCWSIYFGSDPVFHFDAHGQLRRAFFDGKLLRTQGTTLARLTRVRTDSTTTLQRRDLDAAELDEFLTTMKQRLRALADSLLNNAEILRRVPLEDDLRPALLDHIECVLKNKSALAPAFKGKR